MRILGISAFYHDAAACLVEGGSIVAAAQEERFTRRKHDPSFPRHAIRACLDIAGCAADDIDLVVFYDKPFVKFERLLETYLACAPRGFGSFLRSMPLWVKDKLFQKALILKELRGAVSQHVDWASRLMFAEHHFSHAASAFFPSPFHEAAVLTMDGVGEWATTTIGSGRGNTLSIDREIRFPHSLGLLYATFTAFLGFRVNSGEGKVMGLAPYGSPRYATTILDNLIDVRADGSFALNMAYFDYASGSAMFNRRFAALLGCEPRQPESAIGQRHMDIAASIQAVTEHVVLKLAGEAVRSTGHKSLCLAGGVALNCVANGRLQKAGLFEDVWVQPASGDAGGAVGAALGVYYHALNNDRLAGHSGGADAMQACLLGPESTNQEIREQLDCLGAAYRCLDDALLIDEVASALSHGKIVGWFQGRMEFGPRALGARSILADPRLRSMKATLNRTIKRREDFRPFAPSVLREDADQWFEMHADSPHMQFVSTARSETLHAVTHVDMTSRVQTVHRDANPQFHRLLARFKAVTGCPVLVNTSFNVRGEPIVASPEDAYRCFMTTDLDMLAIGNMVLHKLDQPSPQHAAPRFPLD